MKPFDFHAAIDIQCNRYMQSIRYKYVNVEALCRYCILRLPLHLLYKLNRFIYYYVPQFGLFNHFVHNANSLCNAAIFEIINVVIILDFYYSHLNIVPSL